MLSTNVPRLGWSLMQSFFEQLRSGLFDYCESTAGCDEMGVFEAMDRPIRRHGCSVGLRNWTS